MDTPDAEGLALSCFAKLSSDFRELTELFGRTNIVFRGASFADQSAGCDRAVADELSDLRYGDRALFKAASFIDVVVAVTVRASDRIRVINSLYKPRVKNVPEMSRNRACEAEEKDAAPVVFILKMMGEIEAGVLP